MKRIAKCLVMAAAAAALVLAMLPSMPAAAEEEPGVSYVVSFNEGSNVVPVRMSFQATTANNTLSAGVKGCALPETYNITTGNLSVDGYYQVKEATDEAGNQLPVTFNGSTWTINGQGRVNVSYEIHLDSLNDLPASQYGVNDPAISPVLPHAGEDYFFLPGAYLFLQPWWQGPERVEFNLPEGWTAWSKWEDGINTGPSAMWDGVFAGRAAVTDAGSNIQLTVVQPLNADPANLAAQQEFADKLAIQLDTASETWGHQGVEGGRLLAFLGGVESDFIDNNQLLSIPAALTGGYAFIPVGTSENILSTDFLLRAGDEALRVMLWGLNVDAHSLWFREGCIHYANLRFARRNGWISADGVFDRLGAAYVTYTDALAQNGTSLAGAGEQALQETAASLLYSGGTIAATALDVKLAGADKSLDGFLASLLENQPADAITNQYLLDQLEAYSGLGFDSFFEDYVTGTETIPASSFSQLKLEQEEGQGNSSANEAETPAKPPASGFGNRWILIAVAIGIVFALPFILEPYTLRPRRGAVPVTEEEEEAERKKARRGRWWSWDEDEDDEEDEEDEGDEDEPEVPEAMPKPEGYE